MEDKLIQKKEILNLFIGIGETKLDEIIKSGNFAQPIFINGFAYPLYSTKEVNDWIEVQKQKRINE
ncbi:hypothetical protein [Aliarcobacter butzleri]|uniref:hypothetical protein n=1 Tax=Aliarcobacter butzleri TaxID=28197 RepID=UPI00062E3DA1|nr:hypothetical protein [Aliarcobacter butzleri]KLD98342.1 AlpA family transcriptional regulator [Aliarcobacter butzleri L349]